MSKTNLSNRLKYYGGANQQKRMIDDKLRSLKSALLYSYQAATAILSDGREFKCLINPDKISMDLDNKILSIPYIGTCLNAGTSSGGLDDKPNHSQEGVWEDMEDLVAILTYSIASETEENWENMVPPEDVGDLPEVEEDIIIPAEREQATNIKEGDIITWKENNTHWIVYLQYLEEVAYFRANLRRCRYELTLGNGSKYWAYVRGPVEQTILWSQTSGNYFNKLNYSLVMYITKNDETMKYFHRFKRVMINNLPWEVQAVDSMSTPGILEISLKETYSNSIEDNIEQVIQKVTEKTLVEDKGGSSPYIYGEQNAYPYENYHYEIKNKTENGIWVLKNSSNKTVAKMANIMDSEVDVIITTGKSGSFVLEYHCGNKIIATLPITIHSL